MRRSTKVSKQGGKGEQYIKLVKKENERHDDIAASTPNLAANSNGLDSSVIRVPSSGFATFSRVKDRIKFLEQKESLATDTLTRRKKSASAASPSSSNEHERAS
jgi:hypothetical protein